MVDNSVTTRNKIKTVFKLFGLDDRQSEISETLIKFGPQSVLAIARRTAIPRTTVYRYLETMHKHGLVEKIVKQYSTEYSFISLPKLDHLMAEKAQTVDAAKNAYGDLRELLASQHAQNRLDTEVKFYEGKDGVKQLVWNSLKAKNEVVGYAYLYFGDLFGVKFNREFNAEVWKRNIHMREIITDDDPYLTADNVKLVRTHPKLKELYDWRYHSPNVLKITHQVSIYNDVVGLFTWENGRFYGVEIINTQNALLQKQLFETVWATAATPEVMLKRKAKNNSPGKKKGGFDVKSVPKLVFE